MCLCLAIYFLTTSKRPALGTNQFGLLTKMTGDVVSHHLTGNHKCHI